MVAWGRFQRINSDNRHRLPQAQITGYPSRQPVTPFHRRSIRAFQALVPSQRWLLSSRLALQDDAGHTLTDFLCPPVVW